MEIINHSTRSLDNLIYQYQTAENIKLILSSFADQTQELEDVLQEFYTKLSLDDATGAQLDRIGSILNIPRGVYTDEAYRFLLRLVIVQYNSNGTIEDLINIFAQMTAAWKTELVEYFPAAFGLNAYSGPDIPGGLNPVYDLATIRNAIIRAKVSGVEIDNLTYDTELPAFAVAEFALGTYPTAGFDDVVGENMIENFEAGHDDWINWPPTWWLEIVTGAHGNTGNSLHVEYDKVADYSYIYKNNLYQAGRHFDLTGDVYLTIKVWSPVAMNILFKFMDINLYESQDSGVINVIANEGDSDAWHTIVWNFSGINWGSCDKTKINQILIFPDPGEAASGEFWIDDLSVGPELLNTETGGFLASEF